MENRSDGAAVAVAISLTLILLVAGGAGIYLVIGRHTAALEMQAERARLAEEEARMQAERARAEAAEAEAVAASRRSSHDLAPSTVQGASIRAAVEFVLRSQEDAWNRGDFDAFMEHYWKSESLTFSSGGKTTRGWTKTLNRYRERYPTREKWATSNSMDLKSRRWATPRRWSWDNGMSNAKASLFPAIFRSSFASSMTAG